MLLKTLKAFLMIPLVCFAASAATIMEMDTDVIVDNTTLSFDINQFDATLGTLNSVSIQFDIIDAEADVTATNNTGGNFNFVGTAQVDFILSGPASFTNPILTLTPNFGFGPQVIPPGATPFSDTQSDSSSAGPFGDAGILTDLTGLGTTNFTVDVTNFLTTHNFPPQSFLAFDSLGGDAKLTVTYDYDPGQDPVVPEPMSIYLMSGGLLGLGLLRMRRKS